VRRVEELVGLVGEQHVETACVEADLAREHPLARDEPLAGRRLYGGP
jgi:hypothetical protein